MITLHVDTERWNHHLHRVVTRHPGLVPVVKGNGYGFGIAALARKTTDLGVDTLAVGTYREAEVAAAEFPGSVLVLTPWRPFETPATYGDRLIHTIGRLADLRDLALRAERPTVILESMTSMRRHGFSPRGLREAAETIGDAAGVVVEGVAFHLPMGQGSHLAEFDRLMTDVVAAGVATRRVYVSHLTDDELAHVRTAWSDYEIRPRIGTALWLGDRAALRVRATVLDVHEVERGELFGYRGRAAPRHGYLVVVSGGTAHGIGLEAPNANTSLRDRAAAVARGGLDAAGFVRSPYTIDGKQRLFAEPPHMQASMLFLPSGAALPAVGDEVDVRVRFTATTFDRIVMD